MELYAKGQLSFLILTCLQERDFYGLDIISEISNRSNGRINLKKPSVYSNLTRMEKQGYISAYLQSSDFGPNRKYYSLTESGRNFYKELKEYFERNNIDVFRDFVDPDSPVSNETFSLKEDDDANQSETDEDFFDFSSIDEEQIENMELAKAENSEKHQETSEPEPVKSEGNDFKFIESPTEETTPIEPIQEDTTLSNGSIKDLLKNSKKEEEDIEEYNKRLYDISKDINKFKRKRSFAEDQIAMTATAPLDEVQEKKRANIEEFKNSFLENKNKYQNERMSSLDFSRYVNPKRTLVQSENSTPKEELKNDAVFITKRINSSDIERPKKIEPPRLIITSSENTRETKLPAPKRDLTIDPSHKEILTKLYSKTKDSPTDEIREDALYDFDDLKKYYTKQNITFTEYKKSSDKAVHNTNKLYLLVSLLTFGFAAVLSTIIYLIFSNVGMDNPKTNFLYILLPGLLIVDVIWKFYNYKKYKGWLPSQMKPQWQIWAIFLIISCLTAILNIVLGMNSINFPIYATTLILPILLAFVVAPLRYYLKRLLLVKYWK